MESDDHQEILIAHEEEETKIEEPQNEHNDVAVDEEVNNDIQEQ